MNDTPTTEVSTTTTPPATSTPAASSSAKQYSHACPAGDDLAQADSSRLAHKLVANGQDIFCPPRSGDQPTVPVAAIRVTANGWPFYSEVSGEATPSIRFCLYTSGPRQEHPAPGTTATSWVDRPAWLFVFTGITQPVPELGTAPGATAGPASSTTGLYVADAATGTLLYRQFGSELVQN